MMARLIAAATDWTITTTTTSSFTLSSPSTTTKNGCLLNSRTHSHISSHNDGKRVKKLPSRSTVWRCGWWNTSASTPTLCIDKEANMVRLGGDACKSNAKPYSIFSNGIFHVTCWIGLPFWLCDLPRLISYNQYLVFSSGRKIYYAVRIGCVWEKRDQCALLLYGLS